MRWLPTIISLMLVLGLAVLFYGATLWIDHHIDVWLLKLKTIMLNG